MPAPIAAIPGQRYRVKYQMPDSRNRPQEMVVNFLALEDGIYFFDGRPAFGTTKLDTRQVNILSMDEVGPREHCHLPRGVRRTAADYRREMGR